MSKIKRAFSIAVVAFAASFVVDSAHAGQILELDQGDNYATDGQRWPLIVPPVPLFGSIPFPLDFGSGPVSGRFFVIDPRGQVRFTDSSGVATGDFISILFGADPYTPRDNISHALGALDPSLIDSTLAPAFSDFSKHLNAYRFLFNFVCPSSNPSCSGLQFEATLVELTTEAFVLQFNYGNNDPVPGATAGFHIGANTVLFPGPYSKVGPDYCFNHGVASSFTTIAACRGAAAVIPEPAPLWLLAGGLALLVASCTRRRGATLRTH